MTQNTRPPVGSTGTLAELKVGPGDTYQHVRQGSIWRASYCAGRLTNQGVLDGDWGIYVDASTEKYRLISRATPDHPAHTIHHNGREYDLTALETPFGLLPEPVQAALQAWPHGVEGYVGYWASLAWPSWAYDATYRAKPAPVETRVPCWRSAWNCTREQGTCIKRADGSIDWDTWEPSE